MTLILFVKSVSFTGASSSYETGFSTEFGEHPFLSHTFVPYRQDADNCAAGPSRPEIELTELRYNGTLAYDRNGSLVIKYPPGVPRWVGSPTPELDALWDRFDSGTHRQYITVDVLESP